MYDELEQLRKLTRPIELEAMAQPDVEPEDDDFGAMVVDGEMGNQPYDPNPKVNVYAVRGTADQPKTTGGSCGTPAKGAKTKDAIFGSEDDADVDAAKVMDEGLGIAGIGRSIKEGLHNFNECMDMCDPDCKVHFNIGDFVKPTCCETPVILVVKCNDGSNIMTAKPTECEDECGENGCWPEFSFEQDEIEPMDEITLADIFNVMKFNDQAQTECFNGGSYDESPMKAAQKGASENQRDKKAATFNDINEFMEDVFGPVKDYTVKQKITPDQPEEQRVKFGFMGAL